jgi:hypothetical protein
MKAARESTLYLDPFVAGAQNGFCGVAILDLLCLVSKLPLVRGDMEGLCCRIRRPTNGS